MLKHSEEHWSRLRLRRWLHFPVLRFTALSWRAVQYFGKSRSARIHSVHDGLTWRLREATANRSPKNNMGTSLKWRRQSKTCIEVYTSREGRDFFLNFELNFGEDWRGWRFNYREHYLIVITQCVDLIKARKSKNIWNGHQNPIWRFHQTGYRLQTGPSIAPREPTSTSEKYNIFTTNLFSIRHLFRKFSYIQLNVMCPKNPKN